MWKRGIEREKEEWIEKEVWEREGIRRKLKRQEDYESIGTEDNVRFR